MSILCNTGIRMGASGAGGGGYEIEKSLRLDSDSTTPANTAFLNIEPSFTGMDDQKFTISMWIKLSELRQHNTIFGHAVSGGNTNYCTISTDALQFFANTINSSGAAEYQYFIADSVLRDPTAWFHLHIKGDLTLATESERLKISINGTALTANYYGADSQNSTYAVWPTATSDNTSGGLHLGRINHAAYGAYVGDMLLADVYVLNSAKDVGEFGEFNSDTGVWDPIKYTGGYTSFDSYLKFNGTDLGEDSSGNGNDWTANNLSSFQGTIPTVPTGYNENVMGYYLNNNPPLFLTKDPGGTDRGSSISFASASGTNWAVNDILQWAVDQDNGKMWLGLNNTWYSGDPANATNPAIASWSAGDLYLGKSHSSPDLKLEVTTTAAYTPPSGYTYWSASSTGSWVGSGTSISNVNNDIFNTAIPTSGKIYIEAKLKGSITVYQTIGLMNLGVTSYDIDSLTDTPTSYGDDTGLGGEVRGNYCTLNPLTIPSTVTYSNGNLDTTTTGGHGPCFGTFGMPSGLWYWEIEKTTSTNDGGMMLGVVDSSGLNDTTYTTGVGRYYIYLQADTIYINDGSNTSNTISSTSANNDDPGIFMFALDVDNGKLYAGKDGTWYTASALTGGNPATGTGAILTTLVAGQTYFPLIGGYVSGQNFSCNFGQRAFAHQAPSGFKCLCTQNLTDPTIKDPSKYFEAKLYTGTGSSNPQTGLEFEPGLTWIKRRNQSTAHFITDAVRGEGLQLDSSSAADEDSQTSRFVSFNSDGFTVGSTHETTNENGGTYVAWNWDAGSSNTSVSAGDLNSSVFNQSQTWSSSLTASSGLSGAANAFDGSVSSRAESSLGQNQTLTFAPSSGVSFTSTLEVYCDQGNTTPTASWNGNSVNPGGGSWVTVFTGSGTINSSFPLVINTQGASQYATLKAVRLDGKLLVDSGVSISAPTIASTYRVNPSAGFSIVSYAATGTVNQSLAHGLNAKPDFMILKSRDSSANWNIWHKDVMTDQQKVLYLNLPNAVASYSGGSSTWWYASPDSNVLWYGESGSSINLSSGNEMIAYCWSEVEGYSKFGTMTGNGSADGPFVYCGFKPAFIMFGPNGGTNGSDWYIYDTKRKPNNPAISPLAANESMSEALFDARPGENDIDILSNGFKIRHADTSGYLNYSGWSYTFAAFAEHPFKHSRAR